MIIFIFVAIIQRINENAGGSRKPDPPAFPFYKNNGQAFSKTIDNTQHKANTSNLFGAKGKIISMKRILPCCKKGFYIPKIIIIGMVIILSGCRIHITETPVTNDSASSSGPTIQNLTSPTPNLTQGPLLPTLPSAFHVALTMSAIKVNPITLDPDHWQLFSSPIDVLQSDVQHIGQAQDGTMWLEGLKIYRYDGKNWKVFDQNNILSFRGKVIQSLAVASDGIVWFGTEMNEIVSFDGVTWRSLTVEEGGYRKNHIDSIVIRKNGDLCAISIEGMSCLKGEKWTRHPIVIKSDEGKVYTRDAVLTVSDEIWAPLSNGVLYHYDGNNWKSSKISQWIGSVTSSQDGSLWIYDKDGLEHLDTHGNIIQKTIPGVIWENDPYVMKEADDGTIWMGTGGGYQVAHYIDGSFVTVDGKILENSNKSIFASDSYPFYLVHCIFQAKDGAIWFGTVNGIFRYK